MAEAYITASFAANRAGKNVRTSLWTDMQGNLSALLKPVVRANGSEIEIPHSMIARSRLQVHPQSDVQDMIEAVEDTELRLLMMEIYKHPMSENVGARSDLLRHLCGMLDIGKLNIYIDVDELTKTLINAVTKLSNYSHLSHDDLAQMSEVDKARMLIRAIGDAMIYHSAQQKKIAVAPKIFSQGHLTWGYENSVQGQVAGHKQGARVAKIMLNAMNSGKYNGPSLSDSFSAMPSKFVHDHRLGYTAPLKFISELTKLSSAAPDRAFRSFVLKLKDIAQSHSAPINRLLIDHFRFAESVRQSQKDIQYLIDQEIDLLKAPGLSKDARRCSEEQIAGLKTIFDSCIQLISSAVNVSTYLSQVGSHSTKKYEQKDKEFDALFRDMFAGAPFQGTNNSWKGKLTINYYIPEEAYEMDDKVMGDAFLAIRNLILKRLGGGYQVP